MGDRDDEIRNRERDVVAPIADNATFRAVLTAARMGAWETNIAEGTRRWSAEAMSLFGFDLPDGKGVVGGLGDEYLAALHPDDKPIIGRFRKIAEHQDFYEGDYRIVRPDGAIRWVTGRALVTERGAKAEPMRTVTVVVDITEQKESEEHVRFLLRELSHRSKNLIGVIQAISQQTARASESLADFQDRFNGRLLALAAAHNVLAAKDWGAVSLDRLINEQLAPFLTEGRQRLFCSGPDIYIEARDAEILGLAFHELATNAIKYGALSLSSGSVTTNWSSDSRWLTIEWTESGGPAVKPPTRKGFGHTVVKDMVAKALGCEVHLGFPPTGIEWRAKISINRFVPTDHGQSRELEAQSNEHARSEPN